MANILIFPRKRSDFPRTSSAENALGDNATQLLTPRVEDLNCDPWTTRKLRIHTSASGSLIIECFQSADGKRLKGFGGSEPDFSLPNLKTSVQTALGFDELPLFPYCDFGYPETDYMSHVVSYPKQGCLIVLFSLLLCSGKRIELRLWF